MDENSADPIERDYLRVQEDSPPGWLGTPPAPFDPKAALHFTAQLAKVKSEDEAIRFLMIHNSSFASFLEAARFAYPYIPAAERCVPSQIAIPYVSLARAVESFLKNLEPQLVRKPE
jgi:hypothetical protein